MGRLLETFTYDRNTFKKTVEVSAESVFQHIGLVESGKELDKTESNIVGALRTYMGIFAKRGDRLVKTRLADVFLELFASNRADAWRWLVARSLWRYVVPNGTSAAVNEVARVSGTTFAFFYTLVQLLTHLSAEKGTSRFLYFEELMKLFKDDANWTLSGRELFTKVVVSRSKSNSGFESNRGFLDDLEEEFLPAKRDNFNGLFSKALRQTGFFETSEKAGKAVAIALKPDLDPVLQRRYRYILDHPPVWDQRAQWEEFLALQADDLPREVTTDSVEEDESYPDIAELGDLVPTALQALLDAGLFATKNQVLRFAACLTSKRFIILTGLAGSGKTILSQAFARWITPSAIDSDPFPVGLVIPSDRATYYVKQSDDLAIELWNSDDEEEATKVVLPREMIKEWATYIKNESLPEATPPRTIREAVKSSSKFSDQLHSFETHLKAAALALTKSERGRLLVKCYALIPVGADWTGNENILGYPNGLDANAYVTKPALELILRAIENPRVPHFLILDEMNLSHVERYFADILSAIESGEGIPLHQDEKRESKGKSIKHEVHLPENLYVIGTVNVDETTYMFSPKVLDRANVIEFHVEADEIETFLDTHQKPNLTKLDGRGYQAGFGEAFVSSSKIAVTLPPEIQKTYDREMLLFFKILRQHGAEFGYRVAHEAARFIYFYQAFGRYTNGDQAWLFSAIDCVIVQKLLPKLHGSRAKLGPLLKMLWFVSIQPQSERGSDLFGPAVAAAAATNKKADPVVEIPVDASYPLSAEKIARMWRLLAENGFTSFAEA